jgi:succinylarginine dihydrolase
VQGAAERAAFFARTLVANAPAQAAELPPSWQQALDELRLAYLAGAGAACVVLSFALAEAAQRRVGDVENPEYDLLRARRNRVAHLDKDDYPDPATLDDWADAALRTALRLAYAAAWR